MQAAADCVLPKFDVSRELRRSHEACDLLSREGGISDDRRKPPFLVVLEEVDKLAEQTRGSLLGLLGKFRRLRGAGLGWFVGHSRTQNWRKYRAGSRAGSCSTQ